KGIFQKDQVVSTKTLYNYVDLGLMDIKNGDLPEKVKRNTKTRRARVNKRILGRSIDERSPRIESRKDFGHRECDLVLGHKTKDDDVLLTLCERKTRQFFMIKIEMIKIEDKTSASVMKAFDKLREHYGSKWNQIFKSITTDNGSEFADLSDLEQVSKTLVYYAHPYTSCD
ncbi:IS30 family transposase, partial [Lactobacillus delbrueckii]|uniref:IS30 family transposase n=1 Tax=Lactobacillus delbrueckii TaxID=1584 RepID=UPI001F4223DE